MYKYSFGVFLCGETITNVSGCPFCTEKFLDYKAKRVCVTEIRNHHQLIIIVNFDTPFPLLEENNSINVPNGENKFISNMHVGYIILYDYKVT